MKSSHRRVEGTVYFYIVYSLLNTISVLRKRSQTAKLEFFLRLRSVLLGGFLLVTAALGLFSICVFYYYKPQMWTLQWLWGRGGGVMRRMNEGLGRGLDLAIILTIIVGEGGECEVDVVEAFGALVGLHKSIGTLNK